MISRILPTVRAIAAGCTVIVLDLTKKFLLPNFLHVNEKYYISDDEIKIP